MTCKRVKKLDTKVNAVLEYSSKVSLSDLFCELNIYGEMAELV